ncbi:uncharacterized protein BDR25DRAFT_290863 [Lindgomyces ingoldianus]|uniref:Uncharacterized protein n=1 Tax=Lindgomyces ingoldianus TaxID=673940 RepID=A0ACB6QPW0_9PLEO|nr:uncharacterized protein BDR25DRAFT_290863 [Lindgomyces ingoldianus]KAF2468186.1 hypothetical protein BDR25DRAFT_290863 [Lindgomyces ingoldianus]
MYQRHMCPSIGAIRRPLTRGVTAIANCTAHHFHASARGLEGGCSSDSPASPNASAPRETRRTRSANAFRQVTDLSRRGGLAAGIFPSGQPVDDASNPSTEGAEDSSSSSRPLIRKQYVAGSPPLVRKEFGSGPPPGTMVRAPSTLRITRNAVGTNPPGPNLRARQGSRSSEGRTVGRGNESGPKMRQRNQDGSSSGRVEEQDDKLEDTLSNGMVQHLLRLQRQEWDRVPYHPIYTKGSTAVTELVQSSKELFKGEAPKKKKPGRLEYTIGIQNMHGV